MTLRIRLLSIYRSGVCCSDYKAANEVWKCADAVFNMLDATVNCSAPRLYKDFTRCANIDEYDNRKWMGWSCSVASEAMV